MSVPCPCCRASNDAGPNCRRCKADLSLLFAVEDRRGFLVAEAKRLSADGKFPDAVRSLDEADSLRAGTDVRRLRAAARLLAGEFAAAWAAYHVPASPPPTAAGSTPGRPAP